MFEYRVIQPTADQYQLLTCSDTHRYQIACDKNDIFKLTARSCAVKSRGVRYM